MKPTKKLNKEKEKEDYQERALVENDSINKATYYSGFMIGGEMLI